MFQDTDAGVMQDQARMGPALGGETVEVEPPRQRPENKPANGTAQELFLCLKG